MNCDSVLVWKGLRYARAEQRFSAPIHEHFTTRPEPGGRFGAAPWQPDPGEFSLGAEQGDDCLNLNIWAPEDAHQLPVVVWLYGGGFEQGAASMDMFDGDALAAETPAVVVTVNYRVGAYGFASLAHRGGALAEASNLGLRDAICAYEWVRNAIEYFGGDPHRITVAGQSAGGFLACALAVAPQCTPPAALACFSGGASRIVSRESATRIGDALLRELGIADDPEQILEMDPQMVTSAQSTVIPRDLGLRNGPVTRAFGVTVEPAGSGSVVPRHPLNAIADGALAGTFILSSSTTWELLGFDAEAAGEPGANVEEEIATFAPENAHGILADYMHFEESPAQRRARVLTDYIYRLPAARLVETQIHAGGRAALLEISADRSTKAGHGCELDALFSSCSGYPSERDLAVADVFTTVVRRNAIDGGSVGDPVVAGRRDLCGAVPSDRLLEIWKGVPRP